MAVERPMVFLAVLPAALVAVTGAVAAGLLFTVGVGHVDKGAFWGVLTGTVSVICGILTGAGLLASAKARSLGRRYIALSDFSARCQAELSQLRLHLQRSQELLDRQRRRSQDPPLPEQTADALDRLGEEIESAGRAAEQAVQQLADQQLPEQPRGDEHFEVFANLARRLESLVHREIGLLDDLENEVENPDLLKGLFRVDHLATRIRRYAENLAVLGGAVSHRLWTQPVSMADVMRSAAAEIEQYSRVKMVPPVEGTVSGHAVVDVVHLLAELVENATHFSPPQTQVLLRAEHVTAGLAIEVEDRGLGMTATERNQMNALLASPDGIALGELLKDGRIGLYVVSALARRHGIAVRLQNNVYGGTQAVVVLPHELLGSQGEMTESAQSTDTDAAAQPEPTPAPAPAPVQEHARAEQAPVPDLPSARPQAPAPSPFAVPDPEEDRPSLPRRRRQEHLAPELREAPHTDPAEPEGEQNPGLMAAFRTGIRRAETSGAAEEPGGRHTGPDPTP